MPHQMGYSSRWTHKSVRDFAGGGDPIAAMIERARGVALDAMEAGWNGPPFDPLALAAHLHIKVFPRADVVDARTVPEPDGALRIEYNPSRPRGRVRYSIAHEIAHTLFPDCNERVRHRQSKDDMRLDDWQLETLCNIGAAELLMPIGSLPRSTGDTISIDKVLEIRARFEVSVEAILLRLIRLTDIPCFVFACSRQSRQEAPVYNVDYAIPSRAWPGPAPARLRVPSGSTIAECAAIGYTSKGDEEWDGALGKLHIEGVGVQPIPDMKFPRVLGTAVAVGSAGAGMRENLMKFVRGDARAPRGAGSKLILHVVNDKTPNWGGRFARALRQKWEDAQDEFREWASAHRSDFRLGSVHVASVAEGIYVGSLICQKGYGPSITPRIRYAALRTALDTAGSFARKHLCSVHMPRIGCGEAGGTWDVVEELINETLVNRGVQVSVYDLPSSAPPTTVASESLFK